MDNYCGKVSKTMSKEQQIEEIMLTVPQKIVAYDGNPAGQHLYGEQRQQIAEALYNAGYRKLSDNVILLDNDCFTVIAVNKSIQEIKNEAVKDFAEKLKESAQTSLDHFMGFQKVVLVEQIDELLKEYEK